MAATDGHPANVGSSEINELDTDEPTVGGSSPARIAAVFAAILALIAGDIAIDLYGGSGSAHVGLEAVAAVLAGTAAVRLYQRVRAQVSTLNTRIGESEAQARQWRNEAHALLAGLGACIDTQFDRWALSPAEKETALLLLKGLSHKEIASLRQITEATTRQQAQAIYRKAGLHGRSELAAFFLEEIVLPPPSARAVS